MWTSQYAEGGSGFSAGVRSTISARAGLPFAAEFLDTRFDEKVPSSDSTSRSIVNSDLVGHTHRYIDECGIESRHFLAHKKELQWLPSHLSPFPQ